jgi:cation:H+ antiporter
MIFNILMLLLSLILLVKGATMSTRYAVKVAESFRLSKYVVGFIIIAIISILPETLISINSAIAGVPEVGLGTLFGSNVADLTLIFAIIIFVTKKNITIESKILKNHIIYPIIMLIPIVLGLDGYYGRLEGISLIIIGLVFYYFAFKNNNEPKLENVPKENRTKYISLLVFSMLILLLGSHFAVVSTTQIAENIGITPIIIGMIIMGLGATIPELLFSIKSVQMNDDSLAVGDILGTVLADATIVVGILALINPFYFPTRIIYVTGVFMVIASFLLFYFMKSGKTLTKKESFILLIFWILFVLIELSSAIK